MKAIVIAATALTLSCAGVAFADQAATLPVEIVTQDTVATGADGGILVPILTMIFMLLASGGNGLVDL